MNALTGEMGEQQDLFATLAGLAESQLSQGMAGMVKDPEKSSRQAKADADATRQRDNDTILDSIARDGVDADSRGSEAYDPWQLLEGAEGQQSQKRSDGPRDQDRGGNQRSGDHGQDDRGDRESARGSQPLKSRPGAQADKEQTGPSTGARPYPGAARPTNGPPKGYGKGACGAKGGAKSGAAATSNGRPHEGDTLLLRGLPKSATEEEVRSCLDDKMVPVLKLTVCVDLETGDCKGYAFADLDDPGRTEKHLHAVRRMEVLGHRVTAEVYVPPSAFAMDDSYGGKGGDYGWGAEGWGTTGWGMWSGCGMGMWGMWGPPPPWAMMAKGFGTWGKGGWGMGGYGKGAPGESGWGPDAWGGGGQPGGEDWADEPGGAAAGDARDAAAGGSAAGAAAAAQQDEACKLFIGGLAFRAEDKDIRDVFERNDFDVQKVTIATDRETGKSKGYAFVELKDSRQGERAVAELTGQDVCGRPITVEVKGGERGPRVDPAPRSVPEERVKKQDDNERRVFVGGVSVLATDEILREEFSKVGEVVGARVVTDKDTGKSKGFAFVDFATSEEARRAIRKMNNVEICGRQIRVDLPTQARGGGGDGPRVGGKGGGLTGRKFEGLTADRRKELFGELSPSRSKSRKRKRDRSSSESSKGKKRKKKAKASSSSS